MTQQTTLKKKVDNDLVRLKQIYTLVYNVPHWQLDSAIANGELSISDLEETMFACAFQPDKFQWMRHYRYFEEEKEKQEDKQKQQYRNSIYQIAQMIEQFPPDDPEELERQREITKQKIQAIEGT